VDGPGELLYIVYRKGRGGSGPISREPLTVTSFTDTGIARETEYCYQVETVLQRGIVRVEGRRSREICGRSIDRTPPPAPGGLRLGYVEGSFRLSWFPVEGGDAAGYNVYRSAGGGPFVKVTTDPVAGTGYRDSDLEAGVEYGYRVTAVDNALSANESTFSEVVKGEVPAR
jgi:titin